MGPEKSALLFLDPQKYELKIEPVFNELTVDLGGYLEYLS